MKKVLMTDELFNQLGADRVDWGEPDQDGFYTPTVHRTSNYLKDHEVAAIEGATARRIIEKIRQNWKEYGITPKGRIARGIEEVEMMLE